MSVFRSTTLFLLSRSLPSPFLFFSFEQLASHFEFLLLTSLMSNSYFQFKQFTVQQDRCAMKVTTDSCLFGAWVAYDLAKEKTDQTSLLDIGAGTGLLSLMTAQKNNTAITAVEIDNAAFEQAKENINASPWQERIQLFNDDIRQFSFSKKYDFIISNPPFYESELQSPAKEKNTAHHSTDLSLNNLFEIIKSNLSSNGNFFLLLPYKRNEEINDLLKKNSLYASKKIVVQQTTKHDYFRILLKGNLYNTETTTGEIAIRNTNQEYTKEFIQLLKEYYLHL